MTRPVLSFVVMCRNYERYVAACLETVIAALDDDCELVFFDNGSRDRSAEIARKTLQRERPRGRWDVIAQQPELPLCRALNLAHARGSGEFIKPISADDKLGPNFMSAFRELIATADPKVGIWLAGSVIIDDSDHALRQTFETKQFGRPGDGAPSYLGERGVIDNHHAPPFTVPSEFYRRRMYEEIGGFDERFRYEDKPFFFNALKHGWKIIVHPYNNTYYRVHGGGISADPAWMAKARLPILVDQTLRAQWRNKRLALTRLAGAARVVAMQRVRDWRTRR